MSVDPQMDSQEAPKSDKELNFRKQEEMFNRKLEQERSARMQSEERLAQLEKMFQEKSRPPVEQDDEDESEPYVDHKKLKRELGKVVQKTATETDARIQNAVQRALSDERRSQWLKNTPDFNEVMSHAQELADKDPELAETILEMPEGFERQKLVYRNIKAMGLHKKEEQKSGIQDQIEKNKRTPFYQPSGMSSAPYGVVSAGREFSPAEGQNAYKKMKELQNRLRI